MDRAPLESSRLGAGQATLADANVRLCSLPQLGHVGGCEGPSHGAFTPQKLVRVWGGRLYDAGSDAVGELDGTWRVHGGGKRSGRLVEDSPLGLHFAPQMAPRALMRVTPGLELDRGGRGQLRGVVGQQVHHLFCDQNRVGRRDPLAASRSAMS